MPNAPMFTRASPLTVAKPGRYGADRGAPGVTLTILHPQSLVMVIARSGKAKSTKEVLGTLRKVRVMWAGPDQYYVQGAHAVDLEGKLKDLASVIDQSHGRVTIRVDGPKSRNVLAKGTPVDLYTDEFAVGSSAVTQMAHVGIHLTRVGDNAFELSVFRGFSESFWEWLTEMSLEFGYQVT